MASPKMTFARTDLQIAEDGFHLGIHRASGFAIKLSYIEDLREPLFLTYVNLEFIFNIC